MTFSVGVPCSCFSGRFPGLKFLADQLSSLCAEDLLLFAVRRDPPPGAGSVLDSLAAASAAWPVATSSLVQPHYSHDVCSVSSRQNSLEALQRLSVYESGRPPKTTGHLCHDASAACRGVTVL